MQERFSVLSFADRHRSQAEKDRAVSREPARHQETGHDAWYRDLVDEIRTEIAAPRGRTEEERQAYTDALNRAVIGYEDARRTIMGIVMDLLTKKRVHRPPPAASGSPTLPEAVFAEIVGWNVLECLLKQKEGLEEIQVVGESVFEVRGGKPSLSKIRLPSLKDLDRLQQNLVLFNQDSLHIRKKWAEVTLLDGSRVTMTGMGFTSAPTLTIRFYTTALYELDRLADPEYGTLSQSMVKLLLILIRCCFNMVITGPTNSGKTSLIKAMIREMPDHERLVTIESRYELMVKRDFPNKNCVEYEINEDDPRHSGAQAFKLALRQSPKRICHAEIRDEDANIYVRACTRGHDGSITTVHVSSLEDAPEAIADMCMMDGRGMDPARLVRRIAQYVTQVGLEMALVNGQRKLVRIAEFEYRDEAVYARDWVRYDFIRQRWDYPLSFSPKALERMARFDPEGLRVLQSWKEADGSCS
ncbi:MAG: secretion system protein [Paenibacillaceae bacterium]|jgi:pilus assembly protein CpaF|nr:secretion system protein [Paenibacillaceae bacterium]